MAWVRYDDSFHSNPKVTAVVTDDPGALSLHVLGNTWTNCQKRPGFIPAHQPAMLLCDREMGARWALVLVRHGLWHERGQECAECVEEYVDLPADAAGYVIHNAKEYRAPARDRVVAGTPPDLSEKRRAAGRKGGQASADRRKQDEAKQTQANQASGQANQANAGRRAPRQGEGHAADQPSPLWDNDETPPPAKTSPEGQANGVSKSSNLLFAGVSPEPVPVTTSASSEAEAGDDEPTPMQRAFGLARGWVAIRKANNTPIVINGKGKDVGLVKLRNLIEPFLQEGYSDNEIKQAMTNIGEGIPSTAQMDRALTRLRTGADPRNDQGRRNGNLGGDSRRSMVRNTHAKRDEYLADL